MNIFHKITIWSQRITKQFFYIMFSLVIINILLRYIFNTNYIFMQELVMYMHAFIFLFGISLCVNDNSHVRIDVLSNKLSERFQLIIERIGYVFLIIPFCIFIIYESTPMIIGSWAMLESSSEPGGLPLVYILKSSIYVFSILLFLQTLRRLFELK